MCLIALKAYPARLEVLDKRPVTGPDVARVWLAIPRVESMTKAVAVGLQTGRREANKREKLSRIRRAARDVFLRKGFEAATVREIAAAADVAFGTLFLYAKDKRDLLLLIFEEELPLISERAFRRAKPELPFIDQLMAYFTEVYTF